MAGLNLAGYVPCGVPVGGGRSGSTEGPNASLSAHVCFDGTDKRAQGYLSCGEFVNADRRACILHQPNSLRMTRKDEESR